MARVKRGVTTKARHKKILQRVEGFRGTRRKLIKVAHESLLHAQAYAYAGRKLRKRDLRRSWITTISGALTSHGVRYNQLVHRLRESNMALSRKTLAELALKQPEQFKLFIEKALSKTRPKT